MTKCEKLIGREMAVIALTAENGVTYVPKHARVFNPVQLMDGALRIALSAAGFKSFDLVREMDDQVTTSLAVQPPVSSNVASYPRIALDVAYDNNVLHSLAPEVKVDIGSLNRLLPSTNWEVDGGAQVLVVELDILPTAVQVAQASDPRAPRPHAARGTNAETRDNVLPLTLGGVGDAVTEGRRRVLRVASVAGVALREGDVVRDAAGQKWFFCDGALADAIQISMPSKALRVRADGRVLTGRSDSSDKPRRYVADARYELVIHWPRSEGGGNSAFSATSFPLGGADGSEWGWTLDDRPATVEHPRSLCQGPDGERLDKANPLLCVSAGGTWDRPCEVDTECPFYDKRRGRGGCGESGFCEMPLGVDNVSFRKPGSVSSLMMVGCTPDDPDYPWCSTEPSGNVRFERTPKH